jgi:branched-chain amino acid transport system permease protein
VARVAEIVQYAVDAISVGSVYALIALGIALVFGIMRLVNFAYGDLVMVGAYAMVALEGAPWPVIVVTTLLTPVVISLIMDRVVFRPMRDADPASLLIASFAVSFLIQNVISIIYSPTTTSVALPGFVTDSIEFFGIRVPTLSLLTIALDVTILAALASFLRWTSIGLQMRAAAEDFVMARLLGVRANFVIAIAFAISGFVAGFVALSFVAQTGSVTPTAGVALATIGFVATVLGGMGSISAAAGGGFLLGASSVVLQAVLPLSLRPYRDVFIYAAVIMVLILRPQGLLLRGYHEERV